MLVKIIGFIWVIFGILVLIKPQILKKKLQTKSIKKLKRSLFLLTIILSATLIITAFKAQGLLSKILMVIGILGIFKGFIFLSNKGAEKLIGLSSRMSLGLYRLGGAIYIVIGLSILKFL